MALLEKIKGIKRQFSIWLADVRRFYYEKGLNLGFVRKNSAPPRRYRPAIVVDRQSGFYRVIFLTTKRGIIPIGVPLSRICNTSYCTVRFEWQENSNVFMDTSGSEIRKIFKLTDEDFSYMFFCGLCDCEKVLDLVKKIHSKVKAWKKMKKKLSFKY